MSGLKVCRDCNLPKPDNHGPTGKFYRVIGGVKVPTGPCIDCLNNATRRHLREQRRGRPTYDQRGK